MGGSCLELNNRKREMASLGFLSSVKDHDGSGGSASVATPLVVHPGVRLSNTNKGFVCMVRASIPLRGMGHPSSGRLKVSLFG